MKTNTKKLLSVLLALMMMLSVVPFYASAADPIQLEESNITTYPTVTGTCYYGQVVADCTSFEGGVVEYNGEVVQGSFIHADTAYVAGSNGSYRPPFTFVPEDEEKYIGFTVDGTRKVKVPLLLADLVLADENNPPVATVNEGETLSTAVISGSGVINKYAPTEPNALAAVWVWENPDTVVVESGYYTAKAMASAYFGLTGYNKFTYDIYVEVKKAELPFAQITELPAVEGLVYDSNRTWADVELKGGKADVEGTFTMTKLLDIDMSYWNDKVVSSGTHEVTVTFTPDDLTVAQPTKTTITVEVAKAPFKFLDENGAEIVPEITVPYGTAYKDLEYSLKAFKTNVTSSQGYDLRFENEKLTIPVGENEIDVTVVPYGDNNVEITTVKVKVTVEPREIIISSVAYSHVGGFMVITPDYQVKGTFDVYANDTLIGKDLAIVGYDFKCDFAPEASGEYAIRIVYNPTDADPCTMEDYEANVQINLKRNITLAKGTMRVNGSATQSNIKAGDVISIQKIIAADEIAAWIIKDANGNEVTIDGVDLSAEEITFTMPDCDLNITYKTQADVEREEAAANCDHLCHSDFFLAKIVWKMLNIIFRLFDVQQYCDCGNLHYDAPLFG